MQPIFNTYIKKNQLNQDIFSTFLCKSCGKEYIPNYKLQSKLWDFCPKCLKNLLYISIIETD